MCRLQFISHTTAGISYAEGIKMALEGGCKWVQLRMKGADEASFIRVAKQVRQLCNHYEATFIVDDRVELVKTVEADGVHLGAEDMPIAQARSLLGAGYIIGGTANTFEQVRRHRDDGADYVGVGPFRHTTTKEKLSPLLGLRGMQTIVQRMRQEGVELPLVAIGGITPDDVPDLLKAGVRHIAVSGAILREPNPSQAVAEFIKRMSGEE